MPPRDLATDAVSIVVKGMFTPGLFSPAWLIWQQLIGSNDYEAAEVGAITNQVTKFSAGWLEVSVTHDTLQLQTSDEQEFERLRDAAVGILRTLPQTPVALLGINRNVQFDTASHSDWHTFGDELTPKSFWESFLHLPGMRAVTIWGAREDHYAGRIQITVEPSNSVPNGVYVSHNDHFELRKEETVPQTREEASAEHERSVEPVVAKNKTAVRVLSEEWENSMARADQAIARIVDKARGKE